MSEANHPLSLLSILPETHIESRFPTQATFKIPTLDVVSVKKIDDYNLEITNKKGGKVTTVIKAAYAKDGRSRVETVTGMNAQGQKISNVTAWNKQ